ncbi:hypothetical protein NGA_0709400, partial [Nannochloropsis gaditana CCMP526]|uniref:uncharacterized protein n=1 Tax=Nannochloropsis gaditana (strain CCMP526) TaxID=1093141 RepID=UPI00029F682C
MGRLSSDVHRLRYSVLFRHLNSCPRFPPWTRFLLYLQTDASLPSALLLHECARQAGPHHEPDAR